MSLYGLGLGQMTVKSALDQPFLAEIELVDLEKISLKDVKVNIADPENFAEIGLERAAVLSFLTFKIDKNEHGKEVIIIRSSERMTEPYMELVVDLIWPEGQLYKAYTILLDPPGYRLVTTTIKGSTTHYKHYPKHMSEPGVINKTVVTTVTHNPTPVKDRRKQTTYGPTVTNENVWQIAQRYKSSALILPQVVLAIVGANPDAFKDDNLNGLKVGERLTIPSTADMSKVSSELATAEVMAHDKAWNSNTAIQHVLTPPFIQEYLSENQNKDSKGAVSTLSATNSVILPVQNVSTEANLLPSTTVPAIPSTTTQSREQNTISKTELSITASAIESVREVNSLLVEQLRLIQKQNQTLQKQLEDRDKDIAKLRNQVQLLLKQRQALAAQATSASLAEEGSLWPYIVLLLAAAAGIGFAYWYLRMRNTEELLEEETPKEEQSNFITPRDESQQKPNVAVDEKAKSELMIIEPKELIVSPPKQEKTQTPMQESTTTVPDNITQDDDPQEKQIEKGLAFVDSQTEDETVSAPVEEPAMVEDESLKFETESTSTEVVATQNTIVEAEEEGESEAPLEFVSYAVTEEKAKEDENTTEHKESISSQEVSAEKDEGEEFLEFESGLHTSLTNTTTTPIKNEEKVENKKGLDFTQASSEDELELDGLDWEGLDFEQPNGDLALDSESNPKEEQEFDVDEDLSQFFVEKSGDNDALVDSEESDIDIDIEPDSEADGEEDTEVNPLKSKGALDTQLALARTYITMDDLESARYSLEEVMAHGNKKQKEEASALLESIKDK